MLRAMHLLLREKSRVGPSSCGFVNHFSTASNSRRLDGKVAVITGAASGIGKATATEFIRNGAKVILADVQDHLGHSAAAELGPDATYVHCDVADEAQVAAAVDLAVARHGRLDVLHNNAAVTGSMAHHPVGSLDLADFDGTMAVNTRGVVAGIKHAARVMVPRRSGCILCTASIAGVIGLGFGHSYSISKAAVIAAVRTVAGELARHGVRVNAISPQGVATPLMFRARREVRPEASEDKEMERMDGKGFPELEGAVMEAEDLAKAAVYLASDEAKYVSGHNLVIDGGFTVGKRVVMPAP